MAQSKTIENDLSVDVFINSVKDERKQTDSFRLVEIFEKQTGLPAKMWGPAIIGFGSCHYKYESGCEGNMPLVGFSPRKQALTLYLSQKFDGREEMLDKFGKHTSSLSCIYIKKLDDIDLKLLEKMVKASVKYTKSMLLELNGRADSHMQKKK